MEKLYYRAPYVKEFEAVVVSCEEGGQGAYEVVLNRTGFYPEGGGQPADVGTLLLQEPKEGDPDQVQVKDVHEKHGKIVHYIDVPLKTGTGVIGVLDWEKRYSNMQQHSGEHLLSGLIHKHYGYDNVGFHMGSEEVTIDVNGILTMEQAKALEREANMLIYANIPVVESYPDPEALRKLEYRSKKELSGQVRIIEIPGGDICACCGTHVLATGEIGMIKITGLMHYKGGVRLSILCGMRALEDYEKKQKAVTGISNLLSAKPGQVAEAVGKLKKESGAKDVLINQLYRQIFSEKARQLPESGDRLLLFEEALTPVLLRQLCTLLYEQGKGGVVLVCSGTEGQYQYAMGSKTQDMRTWSRELNQQLNGRGGGSALMAQGTFLAGKTEIEKAWKEKA